MDKAPIARLPVQIDLARLNQATDELLQKFPFHSKFLQVSLVHSDFDKTPGQKVYSGIGSLYDFQTQSYFSDPAIFNIFNEEFKSTYFFEVYEQVKNSIDQKLGRVRLMLRPPSSCYSMHSDESVRYHIAVQTNSECYFLFKNEGIFQIPDDGHIFEFQAQKLHTGLNAGKTNRIHLVFDTIDWRYSRDSVLKPIRLHSLAKSNTFG